MRVNNRLESLHQAVEDLTAQTSEGITNKSGKTNEGISPDTQVEVSKD